MKNIISAQNSPAKLHPIFNDETKEFFVSPSDYPPYEVCFNEGDPLGRPVYPESHMSSYIGTVLRFDMCKLFLGELAQSPHYLIELDSIELEGLLFKITKNDKTEVVELKHLSGCSTGKVCPVGDGRRRIAFKMSNFSSKLLKTVSGDGSSLLDTENGDVVSVTLTADLNLPHEKDVFNISDFKVSSNNKSVNIELIGLSLNVYHLDSREIFA